MTSTFTYYIYVLAAIIIGFFVIKKITGCLIKAIITIALIAILAAIYFLYYT
uniref:Sulfate transporter n=4 Tax=unclassified Prevotella TaxID=2638335 RepID=A0AB33JGK1_9BACT